MGNRRNFFPSLFTILNLFFGFLSIIKTMEGNFHGGAWFIILAVLCDGMDGKLARLTDSETGFGVEFDSLADLISFGLAPIILVYYDGFYHWGFYGILFLFIYLLGGAYRLARFNVLQAGDRSQGYYGLPIPIAAICIASFVNFKNLTRFLGHTTFWIPIILFITLIMVSTVRYDWPRINFREKWSNKIRSGFMIIGLAILAIFPEIMLFPIILNYILISVLKQLISVLRKESGWIEFFSIAKKH